MKLPKFLTTHYDELESQPFVLFQVNTPEKYLLYSMLVRAIEDYLLPEKTTKVVSVNVKRMAREAEVWLTDTNNREAGSAYWVLSNISSNAESAMSSLLKALRCPIRLEAIKTARVGYRPPGNVAAILAKERPK